VARTALWQPRVGRGAREWEGAAVPGTVWQKESLVFLVSGDPRIDRADTDNVRFDFGSGIRVDPGRCGDCGSAVDAPALIIGEQMWCEACFIATREAFEQPFSSWSESLGRLFFDE
jgi:hypothetical protein